MNLLTLTVKEFGSNGGKNSYSIELFLSFFFPNSASNSGGNKIT